MMCLIDRVVKNQLNAKLIVVNEMHVEINSAKNPILISGFPVYFVANLITNNFIYILTTKFCVIFIMKRLNTPFHFHYSENCIMI